MPKTSQEIDTRWGSNARTCKTLLKGIFIANQDGKNFWVLLFKELSTHQNDWKTGRLEELITMLMMESMHIVCALEHNVGSFFRPNMHGTP